jgi:hypothetical protein
MFVALLRLGAGKIGRRTWWVGVPERYGLGMQSSLTLEVQFADRRCSYSCPTSEL